MDILRQDLRFALRLLARNPATSLVVVLVLALGIGANTVLFSVADAKLLHALPYPEPDRLVELWEAARPGGDPSTLSPYEIRQWEAENRTFDSLAAYSYAGVALSTADGAERLRALRVTGDFFTVLRARPALGRAPTPADDRPGERVAVLSHAAWERYFASDPGVVGRRVQLDREPWTVIAVMPPDFRFPSSATEVWLCPAFELAAHERSEHFLFAIGRLQAGAGVEAAQADLDAATARLDRGGTHHEDAGPLVVSLRQAVIGDTGDEILLLWGGVLLVLVVACANVANLWLARMLARRGEISVRLAVGGSRGRIVRQVLTESALLALASGAAGVALAAWVTGFLASGHGPAALRSDSIALDGRVLVFSLLVTAATAVAFGLGPALAACRRGAALQVHANADGAGRTTGRDALPRLLVAFQVCFAVVLLTAAGLLVRSLVELHGVDVGFDPHDVVSVRLAVPPAIHPEPAARARLYAEVADAIAAVPGVAAVGGVNDLPFSGSRTGRSFAWADGGGRDGEDLHADYRTVVGDYFGALGLQRVRGAGFAASYGTGAAPVAIVNRAFVERFLPDEEPLGRHLVLDGPPVRIVGVVDTIKHGGLAAPGEPEIYVPASQGQPPPWLFFVVRSPLPVDVLAPALRHAVRDVIPDDPLYDVRPLAERIAASIAPQRFDGVLLSAFAAVSLLLVLIGIYGLIATLARRRRREIAIRLALGGTRAAVVRPILLTGLLPAALGLATGLLLTLPTAHALRSLLYGVRPTDPAVLLTVPLALATVILLATYLPARRAARVDPAVALRER